VTGTATGVAKRVEAVRVGEEHLPALTEFYRRVWDPSATVDGTRAARAAAAAKNPATPGEPPPTWLVLQDGVAIAHVTTIPLRLSIGGTEHPAHWLKGLWVLPEFQRSSAGFLVLREAVAATGPALALVHEPAAIRLFQAMKFTDVGELPNALRVLRPGALVARLDVDALGMTTLPAWTRTMARIAARVAPVLAPLMRGANELWAAIATGPLGPVTATVDDACDIAGVDHLWRDVRGEIGTAPVRGGAQLAMRYAATDGYAFVHVRDRQRLVGVAVVKQPRASGDSRLRGVRVATVSDLLVRPSDARSTLAVLRAAERAARGMGADALLCSVTRPVVRSLLTRRGYLPLPGNLHVLARFPATLGVPPGRIEDWWITRGDSAGDESF
jgi:hypothetical protein